METEPADPTSSTLVCRGGLSLLIRGRLIDKQPVLSPRRPHRLEKPGRRAAVERARHPLQRMDHRSAARSVSRRHHNNSTEISDERGARRVARGRGHRPDEAVPALREPRGRCARRDWFLVAESASALPRHALYLSLSERMPSSGP